MKWYFKHGLFIGIFLKAILKRSENICWLMHGFVCYRFMPLDECILRSSHQRCSMKKDVLRNFVKFSGKHPCQSLFFNKVASPATLLKKRLWHSCFPVNFAEFLRTPFLTEHLRWLLLYTFRWDSETCIRLSYAKNLNFQNERLRLYWISL